MSKSPTAAEKRHMAKQPRLTLSPSKYRKLCEYVYERDQWCVVCGRSDMSTPQHVKKRSQGGSDSPRNLVRMCVPCHDAMDQYRLDLPAHVYEMLAGEPEKL